MNARCNIMTHGYCFDGWVSAALMTRIFDALSPGARVEYRSLGYGPKMTRLHDDWVSGDRNALLDFQYMPHPRLTHYFDHHATAFRSAELENHARSAKGPMGRLTMAFDALAPSCAQVIAQFGKEADLLGEGLSELVTWADKIDSASFDSPEEAFFAQEPALELAEAVERGGDTVFLTHMTPKLLKMSLTELAKEPYVARIRAPLAAAKTSFLEAITQRGVMRGDVAVVDLTDQPVAVSGKFATYVAFPKARYSVSLFETREQLKLGVGFNPFSGLTREHDIGDLCKALGGGGHRMVGAVNFPKSDRDRARRALEDTARRLTESPTATTASTAPSVATTV